MFTPEQEQILIEFADQKISEKNKKIRKQEVLDLLYKKIKDKDKEIKKKLSSSTTGNIITQTISQSDLNSINAQFDDNINSLRNELDTL